MQNEPDYARLLEELNAAGAAPTPEGDGGGEDSGLSPQDLEAGLAALAAQFTAKDALSTPEAPEMTAEQKALTPDYYVEHGEPGLEDGGIGPIGAMGVVGEAALGGAAKAFFETGDNLFGETPTEERSAFRSGVEARVEHLKDQSIVSGFSAGIGQWAMGMFGAGKAVEAAKALPWFGKGLGALGNIRGARTAGEMAKAATVGVLAFDVHEERLANLIESTPLANPITQWLAADPNDSLAEARMKAALESIGMDIAIIGVFAIAGKAWKHGRLGDEAAMRKAVEEGEAEIAAAIRQSEPEAVPPQPRGAGTPEDPLVLDEVVVPSRAGEPPAPARLDSEAAPAIAADLEAIPSSPAYRPSITLTDEDTLSVLNASQRDADALEAHGGWYQATQAGHTFGKGEGIPYVKLNADADVDDFMARAVDAVEERLATLKGGEVLTDASVARMVAQRARLFGEDLRPSWGCSSNPG